MATFQLRRSDLFPVGTVVGLYPANALRSDGGVAGSPSATATVDAAGLASFTVADDVPQVAAAVVGGRWRSTRIRAQSFAAPPKWRDRVKARRLAIGTTLPGA